MITLVALIAGAWWAFQQVHGSGGHTVAGLLRRVLGTGTTARIEAAYRSLLGEGNTSPSVYPTPAGTVISAAGFTMPATPSAANVSPTPSATGPSRRVPAKTRTQKGAVPAATPTLPPVLKALPAAAVLQNDYQVFETWNNCGPASLSMALSYFGIQESQAVLGEALRPYENSNGDNDDKDVTMDELANEAQKFGLLAYHRPNGNIQLLKRFIAIGLPVITETILTQNDDYGHFRVVKGFDDTAGVLVQDDSMQGHNVQFSYASFDYMWKKFNYEYLVLVPKAKQQLAEAILGKDISVRHAWQETVKMNQAMLARDPSDIASRFNLSVALYYTGAYQQSVNEFEQVQGQLPPHTLWYQIEPIEAYYALGDYQKVLSLSDTILNSGNRAFSQLYILRGKIYEKQGNVQAAKVAFENAVFYNTNLKEAQDALRSVS